MGERVKGEGKGQGKTPNAIIKAERGQRRSDPNKAEQNRTGEGCLLIHTYTPPPFPSPHHSDLHQSYPSSRGGSGGSGTNGRTWKSSSSLALGLKKLFGSPGGLRRRARIQLHPATGTDPAPSSSEPTWVRNHPTPTRFSSSICSYGLSYYTLSYLGWGICRSVSWGLSAATRSWTRTCPSRWTTASAASISLDGECSSSNGFLFLDFQMYFRGIVLGFCLDSIVGCWLWDLSLLQLQSSLDGNVVDY